MVQKNLAPHHEAMLCKESGILPEIIAQRGYFTATTKAELKRLGFGDLQRNVPALVVPIWGVNGEVVSYQTRPDLPRIKKGKSLKYEFPAGSTMCIDVHPGIREMIRDPSVPLFITEGIKKADAAISRGLCCIGLLGVWNWRGANEYGGMTALPDWEEVAFKDKAGTPREIYLAFDSDAMQNQLVHQALERFGKFLTAKGARVNYVYFPQSLEGEVTK